MTAKPTIYEHHYQHFENLQMSAKEFYEYLDETIKSYQYPEVRCSLDTFYQTTMFFGIKREYLRIERFDLKYYICAAPFGKSYFISWWFNDDESALRQFLQRIPLLGRIFRRGTKTFYKLDTEAMFCNCIESIVQAAVDKIIQDKGFTLEKIQAVA